MWEEPLQEWSEPSGTGADKTAMAEGYSPVFPFPIPFAADEM